jgi:glycosyltransferase involved in cell wall biosynthesis
MPDNENKNRPRIAIVGIRGVPAAHGGFETFTEYLAPYLAARGWSVKVYCQEAEPPPPPVEGTVWETAWQGVVRLHIAVGPDTPGNSIRFDWSSIAHVIEDRPDVVLMLGYNTAIFAARLRLAGIPTVINMDGIEYSRAKWSMLEKVWLYLNERAGCLFGNHLIADHPQIESHLRLRTTPKKITVIPYGSELHEPPRPDSAPDHAVLRRFSVESARFATLIARPEPENSILEMVRAFSAKPRGLHLLVLGNYYPDKVRYHAQVMAAASPEVRFVGGVYDKSAVFTLRRHCLLYLHGHQVGGTNPSLLEAMGAGNPVLAHENRFNRWVVREGARYFDDQPSCERALDAYFGDARDLAYRGELNRRRAHQVFNWNEILQSYAELLSSVSSLAAVRDAEVRCQRAQWRLDADSL